MFSLENYFKNIIENEAIDGSWMFLGQDDNFKLELAIQLAKEISNNENIFIISNPDHLEKDILEKVQNYDTGIGSIRQAIRFLNLTSAVKKILIINRAEELEFEAQNSLLKTIEEPPTNSIIFFLTKNETVVLPTLRSRMKIVNIPLVNSKSYFKSKIDVNALGFIESNGSDFSLIKKSFGKKEGSGLCFLEGLVILLRDQMLASQNLNELKISGIGGNFKMDNLKLALKVLKRVRNYNVNSRLQAESLISKLF